MRYVILVDDKLIQIRERNKSHFLAQIPYTKVRLKSILAIYGQTHEIALVDNRSTR